MEKPSQKELMELCKDYLSKELESQEIDEMSNFQTLGVSSVQALALLSDLEDNLNLSLPETLLWDCNNIKELSQYIHENYVELKQDKS